MLKINVLIALRSFWRNRLITLFNLLGMALGFGIFLALWSLARFDLEFDRFHEDIDQMYVLNVVLDMEGSEYRSERTGGVYGPLLPREFPQLESSCRVSEVLEFELGVLPQGDSLDHWHYFTEDQVLAVDSSFLDFFSFPLLAGDLGSIFSEPHHLVLTRSLAQTLFGEEDPLDQELKLAGAGIFQVVGVVEDPPARSTYQFQALVGFHVLETRGYPLDGHGGTMYYNNFKLVQGAVVEALNPAIQEYIDANFDLDLDARFFLDQLTKVHLHGETRSIQGVYMNLIMAAIMLLIAIINFINLSTAYATRRLGEISIRKSLGAGKRQLMAQFLGETYLLLFLAMYLGFFLSESLLPRLSTSLDESISMDLHQPVFWIQVLGIYLLSGMLAGFYPAYKIAGFKALAFLSGKGDRGRRPRALSRKVLIVVQFTFSIAFIILSILMMKQVEYLQKADLGFNREEVLYTRTKGALWNEFPAVKEELRSLHYVEAVTTGSSVPVFVNNGEIGWGEREADHNEIAVVYSCDEDFLHTFEIDLLEGRFFPGGADSLNRDYVVLNQAIVDLLGWDEPVGRSFYLYEREFTVLGIIDNIDFFPFNMEVFNNKAMIIRYEAVRPFMFIRTTGALSRSELQGVQEILTRMSPGHAFELDYVSNYRYQVLEFSDDMRAMSWIFSVAAVLIALMGVIGLSVFSNQQRTKEIGIRKVMGARENWVLYLLLREFVGLVLMANALGILIAWLAVSKILQFFAYSIQVGPGIFILVMLASLILALGCVALLGIKTIRANPVDSLRYE